jgi:hypothetical protein
MTYQQAKESLPDFIDEKVFNNLLSIMFRKGFNEFVIGDGYFVFQRGVTLATGRKWIIGFNGIKNELDYIRTVNL